MSCMIRTHDTHVCSEANPQELHSYRDGITHTLRHRHRYRHRCTHTHTHTTLTLSHTHRSLGRFPYLIYTASCFAIGAPFSVFWFVPASVCVFWCVSVSVSVSVCLCLCLCLCLLRWVYLHSMDARINVCCVHGCVSVCMRQDHCPISREVHVP